MAGLAYEACLACMTSVACQACLASLAGQTHLASLASFSLVKSGWYLQVQFPPFHLTNWKRRRRRIKMGAPWPIPV